jgi:hypothetical protein
MVTSVVPKPDELTIRIPEKYLPDVIRDVLPYWVVEDDGSMSDVYDIAGLRYHHEHGRVILTRLGKPGQVSIPVKPGTWDKACRVAVDSLGQESQFRLPWRTSPTEWDPVEDQTWPPDDETERRNNRFISQILRRLPGLCPPPRAEWHDLWFNRSGDDCVIKFEWMNGPSHAEVLKRLLDPTFTPGAEIDLHRYGNKSEDDCYAQTEGSVTVRSKSHPTAAIVLRRLRDESWSHSGEESTQNLDAELRADQAAIEAKHNYRARRPRSLLVAR